MAYEITLFIHSWLRWLVMLLGILVIVRSAFGLFADRPFARSDNGLGGAWVGTLHIQLVLGLLLYFIWSPYGLDAITSRGMGEVMKDSNVRFYAIEHLVTMILAVILAQIGRSRAKRMTLAKSKHRTALIFYGIAFVLIMSRVPWDQAGRLFRGL